MVVLSTQISVNLDRIATLHRETRQILAGPAGSVTSDPLGSARTARRPQHRLTWDESQQVAALYLAGLSMNQVAARTGVHRCAVVTCLRKAGVDVRTAGLNANDASEAARLYLAGWSLAKLEEKFGVSDSAIMTALRKHGVQTRPRNGWV